MKRAKFYILQPIILLLLPVFVFSACTPTVSPAKERNCKVVLSGSDKYVCSENVKTVSRGGNVEFSLSFYNGYTFGGASYSDYDVTGYSVDGNGRRSVELLLRNVKYSAFVTIDVEETAKIYSVSVAESAYYRCENSVLSVEENTSATFTLCFYGDYTLGSVNYPDYTASGIDGELDGNGERRVTLTLNRITRETEVIVEAVRLPVVPGDPDNPDAPTDEIPLTPTENAAVIGYSLNGGTFIAAESGGTYYTVHYPLNHHRRPNTSVGTDVIARDGYVLTGWNTKPDGSGLHIGLGSRANVKKGETLALYAEWAEWTNVNLFDYAYIDRSDIEYLQKTTTDKLTALRELIENCNTADRVAVITKYTGRIQEEVVIPEYIGGVPVAVIAPNVMEPDHEARSVVFPKTVEYIMEFAFRNCQNLTEATLFDSVRYFDKNAFGSENAVKTLHVNANTSPIYGLEENGQLANKLEMIMENVRTPRTVFFGSCSLWYGMNMQTFHSQTGQDAYNLGVIGGTCALYQIDLIRQFLRAGDNFIYVMELGSPYQLLYDVSWDVRVYRTVENNYDLIASLDLRRYTCVFEALGDYLFAKHQEIDAGRTGSYDDYLSYMSPYGDLTNERPGGYDNLGQMYELQSVETLHHNEAFSKIDEVVREITQSDVDFYLSFGPLNEESVNSADITRLNREFSIQFDSMQTPLTLVGNIASSVMPTRYFYDTNYHLSTEGAQIFTDTFIRNFLYETYYFGPKN